jgi:uncharacterized protein
MPKATFRFYEKLNDFLPGHRKKIDFETGFKGKRSIKDMIEALGVSHTEVDLILINGKSVDFNYIFNTEGRVSVYPVFESLNIENVTHLRKIPLRCTKFMANVNLGDITKYLRLLGLDVYYDPSLSAQEIIKISKNENRIILTKSRKLLKFKEVTYGIFIRPRKIEEQVKGIIDSLDIKNQIKPFSRCLRCNYLLEKIPKKISLIGFLPRLKCFIMNILIVHPATGSIGREPIILRCKT